MLYVNSGADHAAMYKDAIARSMERTRCRVRCIHVEAGDTNTITLTVPAGGLTSGIIYDYLRLEVE
jgi:hypothetical protein